jgi:hypothetical protein
VAVIFTSPEEELAEFLASQPSWRQKWLMVDVPSLLPEELQEWLGSDPRADRVARDKYEAILKRIPAKWHEYRSKWEQIALSSVPSGLSGRPRLDALAAEARALHRDDKSYAQIAIILGPKYAVQTKKGIRKPTADSIRKLVKSRERDSSPDKT